MTSFGLTQANEALEVVSSSQVLKALIDPKK
jgi:hypothetical protein